VEQSNRLPLNQWIIAIFVGRLTSTFRESPVAGIVSAYVFGSHVSGRIHNDSDLDLGVLFDRRLYETSRQRFDARVVLSGYLARTVHARDVDLVSLDDAPPTWCARS
jgi:predicted nucleotidyltransferase